MSSSRNLFLPRSIARLGIAALAAGALAACGSPTSPAVDGARWLEPTGVSVRFDAARYADFDDYRRQTAAHLARHKVYLDPTQVDAELAAATPFRVAPDPGCEGAGPRRGIVLMHGLSDMPAAMGDVARAFAERCVTAYSMLLPGHGARPAELLDVRAEDWLATARFGVESLREEVDEVFVGGFSLGGLLALRTALDDPSIAGVVAFSPALALHRSALVDQSIWLRHLVDWLDTDPPDDPWRFEAVPFNALAETQLLGRRVRAELARRGLATPVFIAQSGDDAVVDAAANRALFDAHMVHPASRLLGFEPIDAVAGPGTARDAVGGATAPRVLRLPSELPAERVLSYSHQAVHIAPDNPHYGVRGTYRNCHLNIGNADAVALERCRTIETPWRGEVFGAAVARYDRASLDTLARLTFNPQFDALFDEIERFLVTVAARGNSPA